MSQCELILKYLNNFGSITTYESFVDLGITRLASRIHDLRNKGFDFEEEWVTTTNRYGRPVTFKKYRLKTQKKNHCNNNEFHTK